MANRYKEMYEKTHEEAMRLDAENRQLKLEIERHKAKEETKNIIQDVVTTKAKEMLFEECIDTFAGIIFKMAVEQPLNYPTFDGWYLSLTREQLLKRADKETVGLFEEMRLSDIKDYFRESAHRFYLRQRNEFLKRCNSLIYQSIVTESKGE